MLPSHALNRGFNKCFCAYLLPYSTPSLVLKNPVSQILLQLKNKQTQNSYMKVLQVLEVPIFDFGYFVVLQVKQRSVRGKIFWHFFQTLCDSKRNMQSVRGTWDHRITKDVLTKKSMLQWKFYHYHIFLLIGITSTIV